MALTKLNNISIAEIAVYVPALLLALLLAVRHGFGRNAGWLYLVVFSLARVIGASLQLATIASPRNVSLYVGAATLQTIGLSPLILVQLALLSRAVESADRSPSPSPSSARNSGIVGPLQLRLVQLVVLVGLVLGCVGGSSAGSDHAATGAYPQSTALSRAGVGLMIAGYALLAAATAAVAATRLGRVEAGERRVLLAVALSLPFILVRLAYSAEAAYGADPDFNLLTGDPDVLLGMAVVMEMIVVAIVEGVGITLRVRLGGEKQGSGGIP